MSFTDVLSNAGRSFLRAFGAALVVFLPDLARAPDVSTAKSIAIAAGAASLAAGLRALQDFVPQLQFNFTYNGLPVGDFIGSFLRAALGAFIVSLVGIFTAPELSFSSSVIVAAVTGALAAGFLALQKFVDKKAVPAT